MHSTKHLLTILLQRELPTFHLVWLKDLCPQSGWSPLYERIGRRDKLANYDIMNVLNFKNLSEVWLKAR